MPEQTSASFLEQINQNLGIAHKVSRAYFEEMEDRQDAFQEMMYQLWRSYPRFDGRSKFSTWMYSVCLNTAITYGRKRRKPTFVPLAGIHHEISIPPDGKKEESIALLFDAIAGLSELNKAIVLLYLEDMSYQEIASISGVSRSNVSVRLVRIKKELEKQLKKKIKTIEDVST